MLADQISLHRFRPAPAQIQIVLRRSNAIRETLNRNEVSLQASHLPGCQLIELLFRIVRQFRGVKLEQHRSVAGGLVVINICDPIIQLVM